MDNIEAPSMEQKSYVASVCPEYNPFGGGSFTNTIDTEHVSCDGCSHWDDGQCVIFDDILTSIDQT